MAGIPVDLSITFSISIFNHVKTMSKNLLFNPRMRNLILRGDLMTRPIATRVATTALLSRQYSATTDKICNLTFFKLDH